MCLLLKARLYIHEVDSSISSSCRLGEKTSRYIPFLFHFNFCTFFACQLRGATWEGQDPMRAGYSHRPDFPKSLCELAPTHMLVEQSSLVTALLGRHRAREAAP